jgi:hypothetical protein
VGGMLSNLKNMATDMGQEIEKQNSQLDKIGAKVTISLFPSRDFFYTKVIVCILYRVVNINLFWT